MAGFPSAGARRSASSRYPRSSNGLRKRQARKLWLTVTYQPPPQPPERQTARSPETPVGQKDKLVIAPEGATKLPVVPSSDFR